MSGSSHYLSQLGRVRGSAVVTSAVKNVNGQTTGSASESDTEDGG